MARYYEILKVEREASQDEIRKAYLKQAVRWHPDKHPTAQKDEAEARFQEIAKAYEILSDVSKRSVYDRQGDREFARVDCTWNYRSPMDLFMEIVGDAQKIIDTLGADYDGSFFREFEFMKENRPNQCKRSQSHTGDYTSNYEKLSEMWANRENANTPAKRLAPPPKRKLSASHLTFTATKLQDGTTVMTKTTVCDGLAIEERFRNGRLTDRRVSDTSILHQESRRIPVLT